MILQTKKSVGAIYIVRDPRNVLDFNVKTL